MATSAADDPNQGTFKVLYFAAASTYTNKEFETLPAPLESTQLFDTLDSLYPGFKDRVLGSCAVTVNLDYLDLDDKILTIKQGDEVAIIPPVSSG